MDFELSEEQRLLRDTLRDLGSSLNDDLVERDHRGHFPRQAWDRCGEIGLQGLAIEESLGGGGADLLTTGLALEAFGAACRDEGLTFSICAHMQSCAMPLAAHGDRYRSLCLFSLGRWSSQIQAGFHVSDPTQDTPTDINTFQVRGYHPLWPLFPERSSMY